MRRSHAWGVGLALLLGVGPALAGDEGTGVPDTGATSQATPGAAKSRWFGFGSKAAKQPEAPQVGPQKPEKAGQEAKGPSEVDSARAVRAREEAKYTRRSEVCDKLLEIADLTNDAVLRRRAKQLEERAWAVYTERTKNLPAGQFVFESDRKTLEKHLGPPAVPAARRSAEAPLFNVSSREERAAAKEDQ